MTEHAEAFAIAELDRLASASEMLGEADHLDTLIDASLSSLTDMVGGHVAVFIAAPFDMTPDTTTLVFAGVPPEKKALFVSKYFYDHTFSQWYEVQKQRGWPSAVFGHRELIAGSAYTSHPCYREFFAPVGVHYALAITVGRRRSQHGLVGLFRSKVDGDFSTLDIAKARGLAGLIETNLDRVLARSAATSLTADILCELCEDAGYLLIDSGMRIVSSNPAARSIMASLGLTASPADGPDVVPGLLRDRLRDDQAALTRGTKCRWRVKLSRAASFVTILAVGVRRGGDLWYLVRLLPDSPLISARDDFAEVGLSTREIDVLDCLSQGCSNREIAERIGVSVYTVQSHLQSIFRKLAVRSRTEAVVAIRSKLDSPTQPRDYE